MATLLQRDPESPAKITRFFEIVKGPNFQNRDCTDLADLADRALSQRGARLIPGFFEGLVIYPDFAYGVLAWDRVVAEGKVPQSQHRNVQFLPQPPKEMYEGLLGYGIVFSEVFNNQGQEVPYNYLDKLMVHPDSQKQEVGKNIAEIVARITDTGAPKLLALRTKDENLLGCYKSIGAYLLKQLGMNPSEPVQVPGTPFFVFFYGVQKYDNQTLNGLAYSIGAKPHTIILVKK